MTSAFSNAERSTDVEIAIIRIDVHKEYECDLLKNLERDKSLEKLRDMMFEENVENQIIEREDTVTQLINRYNDEVRMSVKVINEVNAIKPLLTTGFNECDSPILTLHVNGIDRNSAKDYECDGENLINSVIKVIRKKYWYALFESDELSKLMTDGLKQQYYLQLTSMSDYDFNKHNILQLKLDLVNNLQVNLNQAIVSCFDNFTKYHMDEYSSNVHYFNGWKTNKSWYINKRVIIPKSGLVGYQGNWDIYYALKDELSTLEKVFNYLDNDYDGILNSENNIVKKLYDFQFCNSSNTSNVIVGEYFEIKLYKKGTYHIHFTNLELLKKFNLYACKEKGWLPFGYGTKAYKDLSREEKEIVDSFEGEKSYNETYANASYYLSNNNEILKLMA
jgi:hypothetical protein